MTPRDWRHHCGGLVIISGTAYTYAFCARCDSSWRTREEYLADHPDFQEAR